MTAHEHYERAERLVENAEQHNTEDAADMRIAEVSAYCAQARATLALAAAVRAATLWLREVGDQLDTIPRPVERASFNGDGLWWMHACGHVDWFAGEQRLEPGGCEGCGSGSNDTRPWRAMYVAAR